MNDFPALQKRLIQYKQQVKRPLTSHSGINELVMTTVGLVALQQNDSVQAAVKRPLTLYGGINKLRAGERDDERRRLLRRSYTRPPKER
ncbi:hypothetical protein CC2G_012336 [Coprinopsis cinerea AmutBmut pab1-1]|nr:hypothetical protein CC2G_012336 [Coprinopsis cinerea AmutBmut pab1-1]